MKAIYTDYSPEVWELAKKWAEKKNLDPRFHKQMLEGEDSICFAKENYGFVVFTSDNGARYYEKVSPPEFLSFLYNLPEKTEWKFDKLPWPVTICDDEVEIGCQETDFDSLCNIIDWISEDEIVSFDEYDIWPMKNVIHITKDGNDDETIEKIEWEIWEEFSSFVEKVKAAKKVN